MKISCQSCQAKYTIADEKVLGKIVKIRCKKCGATIVINGNEPEATASSGGGASSGAVSDPGYSADLDQWTVNVADGDQRTMTVQEIVDEYKTGTIHDETFCWKDGMNDWLPLREIDSLYAACSTGSSPAVSEYSPLSLRNSGPDADPLPAAAAPVAAASPLGLGGGFGGGDSLFGGGSSPRANGNGSSGGLFDSNPLAAASSSASPLASAGASAAARRTGGRGNQADLFGSVSQAGGEEDVMTSAAPVSGDGSKLTGQRNENSVLFSLGALTQTSGPADKATGRGSAPSAPSSSSSSSVSDGSGLIDIRALASSTSSTEGDSGSKNPRHVDDIMNLGGGGAFSAALAAPVLAPPPQDFGDLSSPVSMGGGQNKTLLIAIIVGTLLVCTAVIVAVIVTRPSVKEEQKAIEPTATVSASATPPPAPTPTVAAADPATSAAASGAKEITPGFGAKGTGGGSRSKGSAGGGTASTGGGGGGEEGTTPAPAAPPKKEGPADLAGAMQKAVGGHAEEAAPSQAAASTAPFNRAEAAASLGNVNISSCKKSDGPTGSGHVKVTFQPSGAVSVVDVDQPPFTGTAVGGCIASKFRSAHVPAFGGAPVTVGKTFSLN